jgi:hypothetical protein
VMVNAFLRRARAVYGPPAVSAIATPEVRRMGRSG